ncbi:CoA ester lyase [Halieaceae bacterium IMCC14734]|uniref:CoA ester lyase n=2 Tax=Candidatus Litorirhabdus singularis TaxID=2518993 RepID=A0ABT3TLF7_9GAMM|nr:CoA ester lyase [Candidatus Litorirhabdus singularis]
MPASNQRAMDKARQLDCDAVIFDLEDAVSPDAKEQARQQVLEQLQAGGYGARKVVVRANSIDSPWGEADLQALATSGVKTICLPKIDSAEQLQRCSKLLESSGAPAEVTLWGMIETPRGVANVEAIASSGGRLEALLMGTTDLANELRVPVRPDRLGLQYALSRCVNAARMGGIVILDSVFLDITSEEGFRADCVQGHALGFDGKTLIHPSQVATANEVYGLDEEQVEHARQIISVWQAARDEGKGVAVLNGKLVETMHVDDAHRLLALWESQQRLEVVSG